MNRSELVAMIRDELRLAREGKVAKAKGRGRQKKSSARKGSYGWEGELQKRKDLDKTHKKYMRQHEEVQDLNEASEISYNQLTTQGKKIVDSIPKILRVKKADMFWHGIHGYIADFPSPSFPGGGYRFDISELKKLASLPIRWIETDEKRVYVAF